jgi:hypothetical protein
MASVIVVDESTAGEKRTWNLDVSDLLNETIPLRELIRRRIYQEVAEYNARQSGPFHGLVRPTEAEQTLNGFQLRTPRRLDWEAQYQKAVEAFSRRGYVILVDDVQIVDLDTPVRLRVGGEVTFLKLVPLVGG